MAAVIALCACREAPRERDGELTIVVEADKSKLQNEERLLDAKRVNLESDRQRLAAAEEELRQRKAQVGRADADARRRVEEEEAELAARSREIAGRAASLEAEHKELARQKDALLARIASGVAPAGDAARERSLAAREAAIAAREAEIAVRETALAAREADVARREPRPLVVPGEPGPAALSPRELESRHRAVLADMDRRGILVSDLPPEAQAHNRDIYEARKAGDWPRATLLVERLSAAAAQVKVDRALLERKMARLAEMRQGTRLASDVKAEVERLFESVTRQYNDNQYEKANKDMNRIALILEGR